MESNNFGIAEKNERCISSPITTYKLTREEIEKKYGPAEPSKGKNERVWPQVGEPNRYHPSKKASKKDTTYEEDDELVDEEVLDLDTSTGEVGAIDPRWPFDK